MNAPNPKPHYTYADYCRWAESERYELIDGYAHYMGPAPYRQHQEIVGEVYRQIANQLRGKCCRVYVAPFDVRLPKEDEANDLIDTVVQPDIAVFCDPDKLDEKGARGAPDWAIEVVSPSSQRRDHEVKRELYQRVGVGVYWVIDKHGITVYQLGHPSQAAGWKAENMGIAIDLREFDQNVSS